MRRLRRNYTAAFNPNVALAALKGERTLAELVEKWIFRQGGDGCRIYL